MYLIWFNLSLILSDFQAINELILVTVKIFIILKIWKNQFLKMKTRAKKAEEMQKFLQKLNRKPKRIRSCVNSINEKAISNRNNSNFLKIKISRDHMGTFAVQRFDIDEELPALIKQEIIDDEYESRQSLFVKKGCKDENVKKNSVSTQCHSGRNGLWLYVRRNAQNTKDAQTQTSPSHDGYGYCNPFCQYLIYNQFCGPACQFLHNDFGVT